MHLTERRTLIKVAQMYWGEHLKQSRIAERMGVNRTTISKYLKKAMDTGIVEIRVANDIHEELEAALEKRFGLKEAFVTEKSYDLLQVKRNMARAGLSLLRRILDDSQIIGMAWGTTIRELVAFAENQNLPQLDVDIVPVDGGPESIESEFHVNTLCYRLAKVLGGRCHYIYAPAITKTSEIREAIVHDSNYEKISAFWNRLSLAIVGIGAPVKSSNLVWMGEFGTEAILSLAKRRVAGEICSLFFDMQGKPVQTEFDDRIIACGLDRLRALNYSIGMAASREKVPAILGAMRGGYVNVLVTDELTAKILLNE